jgi:hypothetical protein
MKKVSLAAVAAMLLLLLAAAVAANQPASAGGPIKISPSPSEGECGLCPGRQSATPSIAPAPNVTPTSTKGPEITPPRD